MVLIYPFVGGTSTTHQYNLKNTSTFVASFVNSPTHGPRGVTCNGTNQYINTTLIASQSLSSPDTHFSIYLNDLTKSGSIGGGVCGNDSSNGAYYLVTPCSNTTLGYFYGASPVYHSSANLTNAHVPTSGPNGFTCGNRIDTMNTYAQRDNKINSRANVLGPSTAAASRFRTTDTMFLMARKSGLNPANYIANTIAWASLGHGLQPQEMTTLYNIVHKYQSLLNRAAFDSP